MGAGGEERKGGLTGVAVVLVGRVRLMGSAGRGSASAARVRFHDLLPRKRGVPFA